MRSRRHLLPVAAPFLLLAAAGLVMFVGAYDARDVNRMLPHGYCFTWQPGLLATHVTADALIGLAYVSIPLTLLAFGRRRPDIPFNWITLLFASFIVTCGLTHFMEIWTIWHPDYWMSGLVKAVCAAVSLPTAVVLVYLMPRLVAIPTARQMEATLQALEREVVARREAEDALRLERDALERRVAERTAALEAANAAEWQARARAESASEAKDRFLASVSHELRTPLQSLLGWTQVLAMRQDLPAAALSAVDRIQGSVRSQARIIEDLLDISRIVSGKLTVETRAVTAAPVVERAIDSVRHRAQAKGVTLRWVRRDCGPVEADPERLQQVIANLLTNAVNASPDGAEVDVACTPAEGGLAIAVRDRGVGIDPAEMATLFEPFRQGRHRAGGGLGLGLAISRSLVEQMGGALVGHSEGSGQGATFTVTLRGAAPEAPDRARADARERAAALERLRGRLASARVLYVEDDDDIRTPVGEVLRSLHLQVQATGRHADAERAIRAGGFDVLVCDLRLDDGHTGFELVRLLRALQPTVPAIAVSAYGLEGDVAASRAAGFDDHLTKPVDGFALGRCIARWLDGAPRSTT